MVRYTEIKGRVLLNSEIKAHLLYNVIDPTNPTCKLLKSRYDTLPHILEIGPLYSTITEETLL